MEKIILLKENATDIVFWETLFNLLDYEIDVKTISDFSDEDAKFKVIAFNNQEVPEEIDSVNITWPKTRNHSNYELASVVGLLRGLNIENDFLRIMTLYKKSRGQTLN